MRTVQLGGIGLLQHVAACTHCLPKVGGSVGLLCCALTVMQSVTALARNCLLSAMSNSGWVRGMLLDSLLGLGGDLGRLGQSVGPDPVLDLQRSTKSVVNLSFAEVSAAQEQSTSLTDIERVAQDADDQQVSLQRDVEWM